MPRVAASSSHELSKFPLAHAYQVAPPVKMNIVLVIKPTIFKFLITYILAMSKNWKTLLPKHVTLTSLSNSTLYSPGIVMMLTSPEVYLGARNSVFILNSMILGEY